MGSGGAGAATEVLAVVPGGAGVAVNIGGIRDDGAAEGDGGEVLEMDDVGELFERSGVSGRSSSKKDPPTMNTHKVGNEA